MDSSLLSNTLERRKQVHIRLRADLAIQPQKFEGRTCYVVKDPVRLRYYRFKEREYFLMALMDGRHTLDDAQKEFEKRFRPERMALEEIEAFSRLLLTAGLVYHDSDQTGRRLLTQRRKQQRGRRFQALTNLLAIQIPAFDPDQLLERMLVYCRWIFTTWSLLLGTGVMLAALLLMATHFETFRNKLPTFREFFNVQGLVFLWTALGVVKIIHEFGHGLSCKAFGGEVHEMGLLILCLSPSLYCNVSDAWTLPRKWQRLCISFAGIYVELIIAALATFAWWYTPGQPLLNQLCLSLMIVCSANTLLVNGNPLLRFDGYYLLADWLEIPNLGERASRFLKDRMLEYGLGINVPPEPFMVRWRRFLFVAYGLLSSVYRWMLTFSIMWFVYGFLKPYGLGAVGIMLAGATAASLVGRALHTMLTGFFRRGRIPSMKTQNVVVTASLLGAGLLFLGLVPLPVSRVQQTALVELQPEAVEKVFVPVTAVLDRLYVRDGQHVQPNDILAEFRSLDLETLLEEARSEYEIRTVQLKSLHDQGQGIIAPRERARIKVALATVAGERSVLTGEINLYTKMVGQLVLRAPRAGVVMGPPQVEEVGKLWEKGSAIPFCTIGDTSRLRAVMPVAPADYRLLKGELEQSPNLPVTIRVQGTGWRRWQGRLASLPESEAQEIPLLLSIQGNGPVPVAAGAKPDALVPQTQQYLVEVDFLETGGAVYPGALAQVKVHCRWRPCAWWLWRSLCSTLDLGLT